MTAKEMTARTRAQEAETRLRKLLCEGSRVYGHIVHTSASNLTRYVRFYIVGDLAGSDGEEKVIINLTGSVASYLGERWNDRYSAIPVHGCGFDALTEIVHPLAWRLFGRDDALKRDSF